MTWQAVFTMLVTSGVLATLITTKIAPHWVLMAALTVLSTLGIITAEQALAGFSNSGLITVAAMFVIASGLFHSGAIDQIINRALGQPKTLRQALLRIFLPVIGMSGFLNNTPVVATMIPAIRSWSKRVNIVPSRLLIPLSYAAILGGTLTLIGTSTNLIVNGQYQALTGAAGFS
ncbi:MAG: SLC13 family permease, partial [Natronospirillum sp.]